jgi:hypothetical protein
VVRCARWRCVAIDRRSCPRLYDRNMQVATGKVIAGKVVVDGLPLHEGETVTVIKQDAEEAVHLSPEQEEELLEAIAEADRGDTISAEELFARLRRDDLRRAD